MAAPIPDRYRAILDKRAYAHLATLMPDGSPQVTDEHIDQLAQRYLGVPRYPMRTPGEVRVTYVIELDRVSGMG